MPNPAQSRPVTPPLREFPSSSDPHPSGDPPPNLHRTPVSRSRPAEQEYALFPRSTRQDVQAMHADSFEGRWYGPVPVKEWMEFCIPPFTGDKQAFANAIAAPLPEMQTTRGEQPFADAIDERIGELLLDRKTYPRSTHLLGGKAVDGYQQRPDFSLLIEDLFQDPLITNQSKDAQDKCRHERLLGSILVFGDLKREKAEDPCAPFDKAPPEAVVQDPLKAQQTRGQLTKYAEAIFSRSHRAFVIGFVVLPNGARLMHYDTSGVVYSDLFDWRKESYIQQVLLRMASAGPQQRGFDPSFFAIPHDHELVSKAKEIFEHAKASGALLPSATWKESFGGSEDSPLPGTTYALFRVFNSESKKYHRILSHHPNHSSKFLQGRFTRGYPSIDLDEGCIAYMKRSWRLLHPSIQPEFETYQTLKGANVRHLPDCYLGGDVWAKADEWTEAPLPPLPPLLPTVEALSPLTTRSSAYARQKKLLGHTTHRTQGDVRYYEPFSHVLHVLLFRRVGIRLYRFGSTFDLCTAVRDAIETHAGAVKANILHRDVSIGNILICSKHGGGVEGMLIDWDLSTLVSGYRAVRRQGRTGTWEFLSANVLSGNGHVHNEVDDLESFTHVLHYTIFNFVELVPEGAMRSNLLLKVQKTFGRSSESDDESSALAKHDFFNNRVRLFSDCFRQPHLGLHRHLLEILEGMKAPFTAMYSPAPWTPSGLSKEAQAAFAEAEALRKAAAVCTHSSLIKVLSDGLAERADWPKSDSASSQFPHALRQELRDKGHSITWGFSEMSTASKRTLGADDDEETDEEEPGPSTAAKRRRYE